MSNRQDEHDVVDLIQDHYQPDMGVSPGFAGEIHRRIRNRRGRALGMGLAVLVVAGLWVVTLSLPDSGSWEGEGGVAPPPIAEEIGEQVAVVGEEMTDWWMDETYQASMDEAYPDEYRGLAALVLDPMYPDEIE